MFKSDIEITMCILFFKERDKVTCNNVKNEIEIVS